MNQIITAFLAATIVSTSGFSHAELTVSQPSATCSLLSDIGLAARGWRNHYDNEFGCSSPYKELGTGQPMPNNLAYYPGGTQSEVLQVRLVLNVNDKSSAAHAHAALLQAAEKLGRRAAGADLSNAAKAAIKNGKPMKTKIGNTSLEIKRDNWPRGNGYEIHVTFK